MRKSSERPLIQGSAYSKKPANEFCEVAPGVTCIKLTQGKYTLIDTEDYPKIAPYRWFAHRAKNTYYAEANICEDGSWERVHMHRLLKEAPLGFEVDHKHWNGLDNRQDELTVVTKRENAQNRQIKTVSDVVGVTLDKKKPAWIARITVAGKMYHLGRFEKKEEAAKAYWKACAEVSAGTFKPRVVKTTSSKRGVCWHKATRKWMSSRNGKYLGIFGTEEEAAEAYRKAGE